MAGIKGQKSGGFGGRKPLENSDDVRNQALTVRFSKKELEILKKIKGEKPWADTILSFFKNK